VLFGRWRYTIPLRLRSWLGRKSVERDLDDELEYHLERQIEQNVAAGMSREEARTAALRRLGGIQQKKEECRDWWGLTLIENLIRETKQAARTLGRDRGFSTGVVLLLAIGVGANAAVFSVVDGILLRPLPYGDPDRLVIIQERTPDIVESSYAVNALHFLEWRRQCACFEDLALAEYTQELTLTTGGEPERVSALRLTSNAFSLMGVPAQVGRTLIPADEDTLPFLSQSGQSTVVVMSDALWRRRFGADPEIVGTTITLDGFGAEVVGVLPAGYEHYWDANVDLYAPWTVVPPFWWGWSNNYSYMALGRLSDGVSIAAALDELNGIQAAIASDHFEAGLRLEAMLVPLHEWVTGQSRTGLLLLLAAVAAALVVACLNIANLTLVRAADRSREAGVRAALGASRAGILRGVLVESALLSLVGTGIGVGLAAGGLRFFSLVAPAGLPRVDQVRLDAPALFVALALAITATVMFGLLPGLRMTRVDPQDALRPSARSFTDSAGRRRFRQAMVSLEVGLSVSLLVAAGLLIASFMKLADVERGFVDADHVLTASVGLPSERYPGDDDKLGFFRALLDGIEAEPGVEVAGLTSSLPLQGSSWGSSAIAAGENPPEAQRPSVQYRFVSAGYLEAMGIPVVAGRSLMPEDIGRNVVVLSDGAARRIFRGADPVGRRIWRGDPNETFEVVGVVPDVHSRELTLDPDPLVYAPQTATGATVFPFASVAVRMQGDAGTGVGTVRRVVASLDPQLAISNVRTMTEIERAAVAERRFQTIVVVVFAVAALAIAALGTYAGLAYTIRTRSRELAIRLALGARPSSVSRTIVGQGLISVVLGLAIGIGLALAFGRLLTSLLFGVAPTDPVTFAVVIGVVLVAALAASWLPARRAARTPVLDSLRYE
jgi:predicted permease